MNKKFFIGMFIIFCATQSVFLISEVHAQSRQVNPAVDLRGQITGQYQTGAQSAGFGQARDPRAIVAQIIQVVLGLIGSIFMVLIVMSGYWYVVARGRQDYIDKATKTIRAAIVGIIVVVLAYSITYFVSQGILGAAR